MAQNKKSLLRDGVAGILSARKPAAEDPAAEKPKRQASPRRDEYAVPEKKPHFEARGRPRNGKKSEWAGVKSYITSFVFDEEQYNRIEEIAFKERLSKKITMRKLLAIGLASYEKAGGF